MFYHGFTMVLPCFTSLKLGIREKPRFDGARGPQRRGFGKAIGSHGRHVGGCDETKPWIHTLKSKKHMGMGQNPGTVP